MNHKKIHFLNIHLYLHQCFDFVDKEQTFFQINHLTHHKGN